MAEAQRAVDEDLRLYGGVFRDVPYLLEAELSREHRARQPHLRRRLYAGEVVDAHLRARVEGDVRQGAAYRRDKPQILNDQPVRAARGRKTRGVHRRAHLAVVDERVERDVDLAAAHAAVGHCLFKFLIREILRAASGVEVAQSEIDRVRAVLHGGNDGLRRSGGRKKLQHCTISFILRQRRTIRLRHYAALHCVSLMRPSMARVIIHRAL